MELRNTRIEGSIKAFIIIQSSQAGTFDLGCHMPFENFDLPKSGNGNSGETPLRMFSGTGDNRFPPRAEPNSGNKNPFDGGRMLQAPANLPPGFPPKVEVMPPGSQEKKGPELFLGPVGGTPPQPYRGQQDITITTAAPADETKLRTLMVNDYFTTAAITGGITEGGKSFLKQILPADSAKLTVGIQNTTRLAATDATLSASLRNEVLSKAALGAAKGIAISGASLALGYAMDKMIGIDQKVTGGEKLLVDAVVVPGILLSSMPLRYKAVAAGTTMLAVRAANYFNSGKIAHNDQDDPVVQSILRNPSSDALSRASDNYGLHIRRGQSKIDMSFLVVPNNCDAVLLPAAVLGLPPQYKLAGAAGAFILGRAVNYFRNDDYGDSLSVPKRR